VKVVSAASYDSRGSSVTEVLDNYQQPNGAASKVAKMVFHDVLQEMGY